MIYYSTGKGFHLNRRGSAVDVDDSTAKILIERGLLVRHKSELYAATVDAEIVVEPIETEKPVVIVEVKQKEKPKAKLKAKKPSNSKKVSKK